MMCPLLKLSSVSAFTCALFTLALGSAPDSKNMNTETASTQTTGCWAIAIHGGAGTMDPDAPARLMELYRESLSHALRIGATALEQGKSSLDVCELVVLNLEDNPLFNAGRGAAFTAKGTHELDASIMDGASMRCGAVAGVTTVKNPITVARMVMEKTRHVLLAGPGADEFARECGVELVPNDYFGTERRSLMLEEVLRERAAASKPTASQVSPQWPRRAESRYGTVGCVALDSAGHLAVATSTGGLNGKQHGRVGDSPIVGAGSYASDVCAVSCTGTGEEFIRHGVARSVAARMQFGGETVDEAARHLVFDILRKDDGGLIAIDAGGRISMPYSTVGMYRGAADCRGRFEVGIFDDMKQESSGAASAIVVEGHPLPSGEAASHPSSGHPQGVLLAIGGGLRRENAEVHHKLCEAAGEASRIVIVTAASGDELDEARLTVLPFAEICASANLEVLRRGDASERGVQLIDQATALFFTGGDQKRIVDRYRAGGKDSPELLAMRRLLARGGVLAGTSAGDAMMGATMFHGGSSAEALGIAEPVVQDDSDNPPEPTLLGPRYGTGMGLEPWVLTDSHFLERNRIGRLVAALAQSGIRGGVGISENGCVEIDLATGIATQVGNTPTVVVDGASIRKEGKNYYGARVLVLDRGDTIDLATLKSMSRGLTAEGLTQLAEAQLLDAYTSPPLSPRKRRSTEVAMNMLSFLAKAAEGNGAPSELVLDGWTLHAVADGDGWSRLDITVTK